MKGNLITRSLTVLLNSGKEFHYDMNQWAEIETVPGRYGLRNMTTFEVHNHFIHGIESMHMQNEFIPDEPEVKDEPTPEEEYDL